MTLDVLSPEDSVRLLSELVGRPRTDAEPSMALRVAELCGHLPLALRVVAERAADRPRLSLAELVDELVGEQNRLDALNSAEDDLSDTRAVFSWSYRALAPELREMFRLLGLHAGPDIGVGAAAALAETGSAVAKRRLRALVDVHLLHEKSANRFRLHDLLRSYSLERTRAEETQEERTQAVRRVLSWYLLATDAGRRAILPYSAAVPLVPAGRVETPGEFDSASAAMRWFETERLNILAALRQSSELGQFDLCWKSAIAASGFFELRSYWSDWENSGQTGLAAARALGDSFGEAVSLLILGDAAWRNGHPDEAIARYEPAARTGHDLSIGWIEGFALRGLGLIQEEKENFTAASELFESALRVFRSNGIRRGEGMSLLSLGKCAQALGDPPKAVNHTAEAIAIFEEIDDTWTVAWGRLSLAPNLTSLGRAAEGTARLRQAIETFREFDDQRSEALALVSLGEIFHVSGEPTKARECWDRAARLYESMGDHRSTEIRERIEILDIDG